MENDNKFIELSYSCGSLKYLIVFYDTNDDFKSEAFDKLMTIANLKIKNIKDSGVLVSQLKKLFIDCKRGVNK